MNKVSRLAVVIIVFAFIASGMADYTSINGFIKPIAWQVIYGYSNNNVSDNVDFDDRIISITLSIENIFSDFEEKYKYVNLNGWFQKIIDKRVVEDAEQKNGIVKLNNGHLAFLSAPMDTTEISQKVSELNTYIENNGCDFVYIQAPFNISKYDPMIPNGVVDYTNENLDTFLSGIANNGVKYIDLREEMYKDGLNQYDYFFRTDHHWLPEGGFWAFRRIASELSVKYGFEMDEKILDSNNYQKKVNEDCFLGTLGRRVGEYYAGYDDISIITPKFETDLTFISPYEGLAVNGDFSKTMFDYTYLEDKGPFATDQYSVYARGGDPIAITINKLNTNDKKILLIRDSFSSVVSPFITLCCKELHAIDLRTYNKSTLIEHFNEYKPDIVLMLYSINAFDNEVMFNFGDMT